MSSQLLSKTNDKVFKEIFTRNKSCMADFLKCILEIPDEEFDDLEFLDPHTRVGSELDVEYILDIKVKTKSSIIDIEMQVKRCYVLEQRVVTYLTNMAKDQTCEGFRYKNMKRNVCIIIAADHNVVDDDEYFHRFTMRDQRGKIEFSKLLEIDLLELKKLPKNNDGTNLWDWLKFIKTNDRDDMEKLSDTNPEIKKAYNVLQNLSDDESMRYAAQKREMFLQDQLAREENQYGEGFREGEIKAKVAMIDKLRAMGIEFEDALKVADIDKETFERYNEGN